MLNPFPMLLFESFSGAIAPPNPSMRLQPIDCPFDDDREAIVTDAIVPGRKGWVHFRGIPWSAQCLQAVTLPPDTFVVVVGRHSNTLIVEPKP